MNSDFKLKIVSLLLAIIVWFHAVTEKTYVAHVTLNIDYKLPRKTYIINDSPDREQWCAVSFWKGPMGSHANLLQNPPNRLSTTKPLIIVFR